MSDQNLVECTCTNPVTMTKSYDDRLKRLQRASHLLQSALNQMSSGYLKKAEDAGCLREFELISDDLRQWLDDDEYFNDLAYEQENAYSW